MQGMQGTRGRTIWQGLRNGARRAAANAVEASPSIGPLLHPRAFIMKEEAPYLVYLLSGSGQSWLTLAVAIGVGLAVVVGLLRIHHDNRLAPIIFGLVFVTISLTLYVDMCTDKREVVALAWDLGAITTGPVTVPMVC